MDGTTYAMSVAAPSAGMAFNQVFVAPGDPYPDGGAFQDFDGEGDFDPVVAPFDLRFQTVMDVPICGDSLEELGEECDDGNTIAADGCSGSCTDEFCGDGQVSLTDLCDDGNTADGDGCSATCDLETPGHACQDAIGKAGAKYLSARVKALQKCRTALPRASRYRSTTRRSAPTRRRRSSRCTRSQAPRARRSRRAATTP